MLLQHKQQHNPNGETTSATNARSVVTFYHEGLEDGFPIKQEVDLQDYEVLVETYKFLARNHRRNRQFSSNRRMQDPLSSFSSHHSRSSDHSDESNPNNEAAAIVSDRHKQAILTLVDIDKNNKRVVGIRPEFFPSNTRVLPACLSRLSALKNLCLDHCKELTCLPAGFALPELVELRIDVTSFQEPFPASFGSLRNLQTFVVAGNCTSLDDWSSQMGAPEDDAGGTTTETLLFPPSLAKLTNLKHLETHIRNILQIPTKALDAWSSSLETLVTIQDLSSSNKPSANGKPDVGDFLLPRNRGYSTDDSSEDDFYHLIDSSDDETDDEDDYGFSLLKHNNLFREALESQLEVRAFRSIARFRNLRSLKLLFDDSKYKTDFCSIRNRLKNRRKQPTTKTVEAPYSIQLSLLGGPLSMSLRELDIGTVVASTTLSSSKKKSRIPIEISWVDILQEFPMLHRLRLQDCRCSFSSKTQTVDLTAATMAMDHEKVLLMPELRHLVIDRCPDFALVQNSTKSTPVNSKEAASPPQPRETTSTSSNCIDNDIEIINAEVLEVLTEDRENHEDDDGSEEIVFCPLPNAVEVNDNNEKHEVNGGRGDNEYFQPLNDDDMDAMMEDPEEISRIIRLSGLLADTVLAPHDDEETKKDTGERKKLSDLCTMFLQRCPKLEMVSLRDCKIPCFCHDLLHCLPKDSLREMTLDVVGVANSQDLFEMVEVYPRLVRLQGTCLYGLYDSEREQMRRRLSQKREQQETLGNNENNNPMPWSGFFDKKQKPQEKDLLLEIRFENKDGKNPDSQAKLADTETDPSNRLSSENEDRTPPPQNPFRIPWPVADFLSGKGGASSPGGRMLRTLQRSNSRDIL